MFLCFDCLQPCQNVPAASNFAAFSQFLAAYSTLDFTRSPLAGKGTWCLLPTTPVMLPTAIKHFDRAVFGIHRARIFSLGIFLVMALFLLGQNLPPCCWCCCCLINNGLLMQVSLGCHCRGNYMYVICKYPVREVASAKFA